MASQVVSKYCQSDSIKLPEPYFANIPVSVRTGDGWVPSVKPIGLYLPHEWFAWLSTNEQAAGFQELESFWGSHSMEDPKLDGNPAMHESWQHVFGTCLNPIFFPSDVQHAAFRRGVANTCH